jgi:hypothetical protein
LRLDQLADLGADSGKKSLPKTTPASGPQSRKSQHSTVVSTVLVMTARRARDPPRRLPSRGRSLRTHDGFSGRAGSPRG